MSSKTHSAILVLVVAALAVAACSPATAGVIFYDEFDGTLANWDTTQSANSSYGSNFWGGSDHSIVPTIVGSEVKFTGTVGGSGAWIYGPALVSKTAFAFPTSGYREFTADLTTWARTGGAGGYDNTFIGLADSNYASSYKILELQNDNLTGTYGRYTVQEDRGTYNDWYMVDSGAYSVSDVPRTLGLRLYSDNKFEVLIDGTSVVGPTALGSTWGPTFKLVIFAGGQPVQSIDTRYGYAQLSESIPEPSSIVLLACGLIGLLCYAWRKRK